ncbi:MAG TPA: homoserine O-acetyltransferase [Thermomicrobiales bacterium]|jgi:homoserine O-acetyltransferase|nr:homoserine O-acetyltransferase [Thermomicrobiales bacterium]
MEQRKEHEETTSAPSTRAAAVRRALHVIPAPSPAPVETGDGALQSMEIGALNLELGGRLDSVTLAYRTWGTLNEAGDNAILVVHALTGDSKAAGEGGWWEPLIGSGRPLDTDHAFVVCSNVIGGCQGSTGPASIDPLTGRPYAMRFPLITIGDMVNAQRRLVERLGISRLVVAGGSIGGFQALEWATRHADLVAASIPIAATESLSAQGIAVHSELGRRAIMADPNWRGGEYASEGVFPTEGLAIARMAAMTTYHSNESMAMRFGRTPATRPGIYPSFGGTFDVEGYLQYQGAKLVRRFDANSYLYLTRAMDLYDLSRNGGEAYWLRQIAAPVLLVGIRSDWLFPPEGVRALAERINEAGGDAQYAELDSPHGHDAFLKEWDMLDDIIRPFIAQTPAGDARR